VQFKHAISQIESFSYSSTSSPQEGYESPYQRVGCCVHNPPERFEAREFLKVLVDAAALVLSALSPCMHAEVTLKLPKQLMTFLRAIEQTLDGTLQELLEEPLIDTVHAQLPDETLLTPSRLMEKSNLKPIFEACMQDLQVGLCMVLQ